MAFIVQSNITVLEYSVQTTKLFISSLPPSKGRETAAPKALFCWILVVSVVAIILSETISTDETVGSHELFLGIVSYAYSVENKLLSPFREGSGFQIFEKNWDPAKASNWLWRQIQTTGFIRLRFYPK